MASGIIKFLEKEVCAQTAVYWGNPQNDGYGGYTYDDPVEISCRWDEITQLVTDEDSRQFTSDAEIIVLQDVDKEGMLYLGSLDDIESAHEANPEQVDGAKRIRHFDKSPLFGSTSEFVRVAYLGD